MARQRIPKGVVRRRLSAYNRPSWTANRVALLGTHPDDEVARKLGILLATVERERSKRGIAALNSKRATVEWTDETIESNQAVIEKRKSLGTDES